MTAPNETGPADALTTAHASRVIHPDDWPNTRDQRFNLVRLLRVGVAARAPHILSASDWNRWFTTDCSNAVSDSEADLFQTLVSPSPGMTAVDLACGTGQWTRQLAAWGLTVTGYDYSAEALRQADTAGPQDGLSYVRWDILGDPIPPDLQPGSLDLVTCRHALPYLESARLLTDVGRWLKPDGIFYALVRIETETQQRGAAEPDATPESFHRGLTETQFSALGSGWARRDTYRLSHEHRSIA